MPTTRSRKAAAAKAEAAAKAALENEVAAAAKHAAFLAKRRVRDRENYRKKKEAGKLKKAAKSKHVKTVTEGLDQGAASNKSLGSPGHDAGSSNGGAIASGVIASPSKTNPNYSTEEKELIVKMGMTYNMTYSATYKGPKANKKRPLQQIADLLNKGYHNGCPVRTWRGVQAFINRTAAEFVDYQRKLAQCNRHVRGAGGDNADDADDVEVPEFWPIAAPFWKNVASGGVEQMKDFDGELYHQYDNMAAKVNVAAAKRRSFTPATVKKSYNNNSFISVDSSEDDDSDMDTDVPSNSPHSLKSKRASRAQLKDMRDVNKTLAARSAAKRRKHGSVSASQQASKKAKTKNTRHKTEEESAKEEALHNFNSLAKILVKKMGASAQDSGYQHSPAAAVAAPAVLAANSLLPTAASTSAVASVGAQAPSIAPLNAEAKQARAKRQMQMLENAKSEYNLSADEVKSHRARIIAEMLA